MQLLLAHLILIGTAIGLGFGFAMRALVVFLRHGERINLALSIASFVVAIGLSLYFRKVRARWKERRRKPAP